MTWTKLADNFGDHQKVERISNDALALYIVGLVDCNRRLTDGVISRTRLRVLQAMRSVGDDAVNELMDVELWHQNGDGDFEVHNFLEYNPTAREEKKRLAANRQRMKQARRAKARAPERATEPAAHVRSTRTRPGPDPVPDPDPPHHAGKASGTETPSKERTRDRMEGKNDDDDAALHGGRHCDNSRKPALAAVQEGS